MLRGATHPGSSRLHLNGAAEPEDRVLSKNSNGAIWRAGTRLNRLPAGPIYTLAMLPLLLFSVSSADVRRLGQPLSAGCNRVSPGREPCAQGALGSSAHSFHRCRAAPRPG